MGVEILHDPAAQRFVVEVDGRRGHLRYRRIDERTLDYFSTFVPPELRGRGIGAALVRHALEDARERGLKVVPTCPFVARMIAREPRFADLVAD